jgi:hypothetical protein
MGLKWIFKNVSVACLNQRVFWYGNSISVSKETQSDMILSRVGDSIIRNSFLQEKSQKIN